MIRHKKRGCGLFFALVSLGMVLPYFAWCEDYHSNNIIVIRHAEKNPSGGLNIQGKLRALKLAQMLKKAKIKKIYATNYPRTLQTAKPTAKDHALDVTIYHDESELVQQVAMELDVLEDNAGILIVGHSNTLAQIVHGLGGPSIDDIPEDSFKNLFILSKNTHGTSFLKLQY
jgi:phosphohistidine phosphatase SixA